MVSYSGEVSPGGPPDVRHLSGLSITKVAVDPQMSNNCYLLTCARTGERVLVDAAADSRRLLRLLGDEGLSAVVTTHRHWDHHRALADVVSATGAAVVVGEPDADAVTDATGVTVDQRVTDGDVVAVGDQQLRVIAVAGHTPGSICLLYDDPDGPPHLLTGDSLFPGGVGKTWSAADFHTLVDQVEQKIFDVLPDDTWFYPGHGNDSTLGVERPHLPEWRARGW